MLVVNRVLSMPWVFEICCNPIRNNLFVGRSPFQMYVAINQADLASLFSQQDLFVLLFSALCHDLDHPGLTNFYQVSFFLSLFYI